ncbi:hypothetical protein C2R22_21580 (plasmid) [Salinigranum rubrum]|uniref:Uncharacterized protein n=1 Tax=Salinigranum rubrum TaxID=755307 RepID=A0A2I8VQG7_9EURY|nr:hypothetical protein [Salinigranum rubrum]AUV84167.1 hypothetical protein C2R22_21580 [Salinigranum rubrum]
MLQRERFIELGLAIAIFSVASVVLVAPTWIVGVLALALAIGQLVRARRAEGWAIVDTGFGVFLLLLGGTTVVTPEWGVPLLYIAGGIQLTRAIGEVGMAINLALLAALAFARETPDWAVAILVIAAVGKALWVLQESLRDGSFAESMAT